MGLTAVLSFMDASIKDDYNMVYIAVIVKEGSCPDVWSAESLCTLIH